MRFVLLAALCAGVGEAYTAIDANTNQTIPHWPILPTKLDSQSLGIGKQEVAIFTTSLEGQRFQQTNQTFSASDAGGWHVYLDPTRRYQTFLGVGGAITDAAIINLKSMTPDAADAILEGYYGAGGLKYSVGRIPIGSCDFSASVYSYDDSPSDFALTNFTIGVDVASGKIDVIKAAIDKSAKNGVELNLFGSAWSAPGWMKTTGQQPGGGSLIGDAEGPYYKTWANYLKKFLDSYSSEGINFWGITTQNEPSQHVPWQSMDWTAETQRDFLKNDLGPLLRAHYPELNIMIYDDARNGMPAWVQTVLSDPEAAQYVDGVGFHWYNEVDDNRPGFFYVQNVHEAHPEVFLLATEASEGSIPSSFGIGFLVGPQGPLPGSWTRGANYGHDILQDLENWSVGWTDWNIVLNAAGGPNWIGNVVDAPIITDAVDPSTFHVQPMYYHLGHFSAFIPTGSVRISIAGARPDPVELTAWETPCGDIVIVALNQDEFPILGDRSYNIHVPHRGWININMPPGSIQTIVFKAPSEGNEWW